jgi:hypothetical protein
MHVIAEYSQRGVEGCLKLNANVMKTNSGKKKVYVAGHKKSNGTKVKTHYRSTPNK